MGCPSIPQGKRLQSDTITLIRDEPILIGSGHSIYHRNKRNINSRPEYFTISFIDADLSRIYSAESGMGA